MARSTIQIPGPLRSFVAGTREAVVDSVTAGAAIQELVRQFPTLGRHLLAADGSFRPSVTIYVNDQDVRYLRREATPLQDGDVLSIVPALAGGSEPVALGSEMPRDRPLGLEELRRYSRHLLLPEVGVAGQKRLRDAKVLLVGAGGLGAPTSLYLAAAGVGEIGLVEFDQVELSNLQRQVLYTTHDVGRPKIEAAAARLTALNPDVRVTPHPGRLTAANALDVLRGYDLVIDGTDNFPTRYLVNDAAVLLGIPNVYGSIYRFEGQVSVFDATRGPCYRCLYAEPPPPDQVPSCAEGGVLGVLPGLIGVLQATEAVKLITGIGEPLIGRLLLYDALAMQFRELHLNRNPTCVLCSPAATQTGLIDYAEFCGVGEPPEGRAERVPTVTPEELKAELARSDPPWLIDVREPNEWAIAHLEGARLIPRGSIPEHVSELAGAPALVLYCRSGNRSGTATRLLLDLGFTNVRSLAGGINAWAEKVDPSIPRY